MVTYRRNRPLPGGSYFFTVTLLDRSSCLLTERIEDLREAFRSMHRDRPVRNRCHRSLTGSSPLHLAPATM